MPLTDPFIRAQKPSPKAQKHYDGGGLYLEVSPKGGKWWRLKFRFAGKEKRISLGTYPDTGLAGARDKRDKARKLLADGIDPSAMRKAERTAQRAEAANTFEPVARAWLQHRASGWAERTQAIALASLENDVFPVLGKMKLSAIQPSDIRDLVKSIEARGAGETAGRVFQRLRAVFRYAIAHDNTATDPTYPLKPGEIFKKRTVKHRAALAERDVPAYLHRLSGYDGDPSTKLALQLLMLTAVRPGELRGARWSEIDTDRALWRIPAERMKMKTEHIVPLSPQALATLVKMQALSGNDTLVFPSPFYPGKPLSDGTLNSALARMGYKGIATAHGFRTLFSTSANEAGWKGDLIEKQLAHEERDEVRGSYNRALWLEDRTKLMKWWADRLDQLRKGAEVLPFKAA
jgi:integrase